jgi:thiol-disulfide isomerase/thioredoxin
MTRETSIQVLGTGALCATLLISACSSTRHDEPVESVPATAIVPMKAEPAEAAPVTLHVGDAAPVLSYEQWIQGPEVHAFEAGKVYVVEFWATWCPPCVKSVPHINQLQHDHPEVVFIGLAGSEHAPKEGAADTRVEGVRDFIAKQGDQMTYRVAYDADRSMSASWMKPAGQGGIPCSFIIGRGGRITWIGHPSQMEGPLAEALKAN